MYSLLPIIITLFNTKISDFSSLVQAYVKGIVKGDEKIASKKH